MTTVGDLADSLDGLRRRLTDELRRAAIATALEAEGLAKQNATRVLNVRSGRLRNSIRGTVEDIGNEIAVVLRAGDTRSVTYARVHEEGGVIRATRARFLKIPVGPALTGAGVPRLPATRGAGGRFVKGGSALRFVPRAGGGLLVDASNRVWFVLKPSVTIKARPYLAPAIRDAEPGLIRRLESIVVEGVR